MAHHAHVQGVSGGGARRQSRFHACPTRYTGMMVKSFPRVHLNHLRSTFPSFGHFSPQGTTRHNWSWQARCSHLLSFSLPLPCRPPSTTLCRRPLPCAAATGATPAGLSVLGPSVSSQGKASGLRPSDPQISQDRPQRLHRLKGQPSVQPRCWSGWCSEGGSVLQRVRTP